MVTAWEKTDDIEVHRTKIGNGFDADQIAAEM